MEVLFIEAKKKFKEKIEINEKLPKKLHILYTIQYKNLAEKIKKELERRGHKILGFEQILGCSEIKPLAPLLLISSGKFHAISLAASTNKEIFIYDKDRIRKISKQDIRKLKAILKGKISKFLASENIGLLISKKSGQDRLSEAREIMKKLEKKFKEKNFYLFISNTIDGRELENFSIDFWINLACPGIEFDSSRIINYKRVLKEARVL
jgi:diphthamide biosynthesis enzyme Dph1/Dph2-like protein